MKNHNQQLLFNVSTGLLSNLLELQLVGRDVLFWRAHLAGIKLGALRQFPLLFTLPLDGHPVVYI